jgi:hypothetical protein
MHTPTLTLVSRINHRFSVYDCSCGTRKTLSRYDVQRGAIKSCGCHRRRVSAQKVLTHGLSKTKIYMIWSAMIQRCENPDNKGFKNYGGRGITVCERWHDFENFYSDMGDRPTGKSIERKDNNGAYSPENCVWANRSDQNSNTRRNHFLEFGGVTDTMSGWARRIGIDPSAMIFRLKTMPFEKAMTKPRKNYPLNR